MISVCMATFNGAQFIKEQLDSILSQLSSNDEIIVSDDCSNDETIQIIKSYNDNRIKIYTHQKKQNEYFPESNIPYATFNFENALKFAKGDIIFLSDQDDIWYPNKVKKNIELIKQYDFIMSNYSLVDKNLQMIKEKNYSKKPFSRNLLKTLFVPHLIGCCFCFKRSVLEKALPFPSSTCCHDLWIGTVALKFFKVYYCDEPLIYHRVWEYNTSAAGKKSQTSIWYKIKYRFLAFKNIVLKR